MKISIVIPSFNQLQELEECLMATAMQTFKDFEIIVIDGASEAFDEDYLKEKFKTIKVVSKPDKNVYDAMNKGIALAENDWLYFMGVDDCFYDHDVLKSVVPFLDEKKVKVVLGQIVYKYDKEDSFFLRKNNGVVRPEWSSKIWFKNTMPHQGMFYHRSIFLEHSYDIGYEILADYALNLKLWRKGVPVLILDKRIAHCGTQGLSKNYNLKLYREEVRLKTKATSVLLKPVFILIAMFKYGLKNLYPFR